LTWPPSSPPARSPNSPPRRGTSTRSSSRSPSSAARRRPPRRSVASLSAKSHAARSPFRSWHPLFPRYGAHAIGFRIDRTRHHPWRTGVTSSPHPRQRCRSGPPTAAAMALPPGLGHRARVERAAPPTTVALPGIPRIPPDPVGAARSSTSATRPRRRRAARGSIRPYLLAFRTRGPLTLRSRTPGSVASKRMGRGRTRPARSRPFRSAFSAR
jgi:hypothetical protein